MSVSKADFERVPLTASAVVSWRVVGTVFLTCLMETGPVAGVGFSLMAGSIAPSPHLRKGNFGKVVPRGRRVCGREFFGEWD